MKLIIDKLLNDKKTNVISILVLIFVSLIMLFPAGALNTSSIVENTAEYIADITENHTVSGTYTALMIEPNDGTDKKINNPYNEFYHLYGIFREGLATYVGSANAEKSHVVKIKELEDNSNFSFLNADTGFDVKEYYKDSEGNMIFKQEFYPLELMFYSSHPFVPGALSFIYIPQSKADLLLDKSHLEHTRENYRSLLNSIITLEIDGKEYKYAIDNIYLEQHYFYEALNEVMGDFLFGGAFYPSGTLKKQALFFLRNYTFQNSFYINYATSSYSASDFNYQILDRNFKDGFVIDESQLIYFPNFSNTFSILILLFSILFLLSSLALLIFGCYEGNMRNHLLVACSLLLPYLVFWAVHAFTKSAIIFSNFSIVATIWYILVFVVIYLITLLSKRSYKIKKEKV